MFSSERAAEVVAADGSKLTLFVDADLVRHRDGKKFIPVGLVDEHTVVLPQEPLETGSPFVKVDEVITLD
jgi:hypothetical protein